MVKLIILVVVLGWAGVPLLPAAERPNILFCISDDQSWPHAGAYGCSWVKTPGFDRVAREGLLFNRCYTPNAKCAPSRACILTGRNPWQLEAACNHWCYFPPQFKTVMEGLGENGYFCGFTSKGWAPGIAKDAEGQPRNLTGKRYNAKKQKPPAGGISSADYAGNFGDFLADVPEGKPWMFWYGCTEPHRRYEYGSGVKKGGKALQDLDEEVFRFWPDNEVTRNDMLDYAFEVEHFDAHLVRMLAALEENGQLENTLVIVTADNGMPFPRIKGQKYELSAHLPLGVMWKRGIVKPGRVIDDYVSFIDFAPTFLELAGLTAKQAGMQPVTGRSLVEIFNSERDGQVVAERDHVLLGKERHDVGRPNDSGYPVRGIVSAGILYLRNYEPDRWPQGDPVTGYLNCDGGATKTEILKQWRSGEDESFWEAAFGKRPAEEMYFVEEDVICDVNIANQPEATEVKSEMREQMERELVAQGDPRLAGKKGYFEKMPYADENGRGFYEKFMAGKKPKSGWVNPGDFEKRNPE